MMGRAWRVGITELAFRACHFHEPERKGDHEHPSHRPIMHEDCIQQDDDTRTSEQNNDQTSIHMRSPRTLLMLHDSCQHTAVTAWDGSGRA